MKIQFRDTWQISLHVISYQVNSNSRNCLDHIGNVEGKYHTQFAYQTLMLTCKLQPIFEVVFSSPKVLGNVVYKGEFYWSHYRHFGALAENLPELPILAFDLTSRRDCPKLINMVMYLFLRCLEKGRGRNCDNTLPHALPLSSLLAYPPYSLPLSSLLSVLFYSVPFSSFSSSRAQHRQRLCTRFSSRFSKCEWIFLGYLATEWTRFSGKVNKKMVG